jgi:hypothetical protein
MAIVNRSGFAAFGERVLSNFAVASSLIQLMKPTGGWPEEAE